LTKALISRNDHRTVLYLTWIEYTKKNCHALHCILIFCSVAKVTERRQGLYGCAVHIYRAYAMSTLIGPAVHTEICHPSPCRWWVTLCGTWCHHVPHKVTDHRG